MASVARKSTCVKVCLNAHQKLQDSKGGYQNLNKVFLLGGALDCLPARSMPLLSHGFEKRVYAQRGIGSPNSWTAILCGSPIRGRDHFK